jgi:hypothetical protein
VVVVIGSYALNYRLDQVDIDRPRSIGDIDMIGTHDELNALIATLRQSDLVKITQLYITNRGNKTVIVLEPRMITVIIQNQPHAKVIIEFDVMWNDIDNSDRDIVELYNRRPEMFDNVNLEFADFDVFVPNLDILYMIKMSHRYRKNSPHFRKTMFDIKVLRYALGTKDVNVDLTSIYRKRMKETYSYAHPSLKQSKNSFFRGDQINYIYDHDSIHCSVAFNYKPAYLFYKGDNQEVMCDREKFFACTETMRIHGVVEEALVLALERSQIPFRDRNINPDASFMMALEKVCTSITSGWFREFAWENFDRCVNVYQTYCTGSNCYVKRFWDDVANNRVAFHQSDL